MAASAPQAVAELRRQGEDYVADLIEIAALALTLLLTGRREELDTLLTARAERYRAQGPPTCSNWALTMLGLSASMQGRQDQAWQLLDESASVAVPDRTHTMKNPLEARAALRRGHRSRAVRNLRSYIDELVDHENMHLARLACVEFINMMAKIDRLPDAARMLGHLETTGALDAAIAYRALVADAARMVAAHPPAAPAAPGRDLDDRQALAYMRDVLDRLAAEI